MNSNQQDLAEKIFTVIGGIPEGKVASYGQIARLAGYPKHARKVGQLLKNLPAGSSLPWYRVVNSQRRISFPANSAKFDEQKARLEAENVRFSASNVIAKSCFWD
ncbi:MGMT family protein [Pseudoalteromonas piscicida]|uniref:Cysteine methyltransferase n=1 Tax=Pseudoalteromonas piscicida TaxID=43662 RepID=A0A2A5JTN7_PSEO7|nr:MGMT family protein [Pseudoalteromonas piscicida]PCK32736.1 cysteine methyltransferase [Pseudoalteromonas piscicida]